MSEHEKLLQVGRLGEEYSQLKGELNHVMEKINRAQSAYSFAGSNFNNLRVDGDRLLANTYGAVQVYDFTGLANESELVHLFRERDRLVGVLKETGDRLRALAPHLV
jgi:hypothetical protein